MDRNHFAGADRDRQLVSPPARVRARGVLTPLLVQPGSMADHFEIVTGRRRYQAVLANAGDGSEAPLLPCANMADGDDAAALEASIIENYAREDPTR